MAKNFAITGASGYVAPRHLQAIRDTGNRLVAALDPSDSAGVLDQYSFDVRFFKEFERFERHLEKLRRLGDDARVQWLSVCSPNYLHDAHCRLALRIGADAICEKPLVINPWNLDALQQLESETGRRIWTVLQLRAHAALVRLREQLHGHHDVVLTYVTARGPWYDVSWKGSEEKSGGIAMNIGVHFFDLLLWLFGGAAECRVQLAGARRMAGTLELERARVRWFLSIEPEDLPFPPQPGRGATHRSMTIDGQQLEFTEGFANLHTRVYEEILAGRGFGIDDVRPSIELTARIRGLSVSPAGDFAHPFLRR
ncbi:MAG TPA: Gfo/Idh/MocA family oxidoreductase [Thermoanaerobaculia bacterium]|nr:Gfo/Idh/MocA family oxidoreductase [Thermoanaerobaculia bacterium]